jgi:carbon-monoxide dehydrogenase medium subunit
MTPFDFVRPQSLSQAVALLDPDDPHVLPVGGATALIQMMKVGVLRPTRLVFLDRVESVHSEIRVDAQGNLHLGGLARLSALEHSSLVQQGWPVLTGALHNLANVRVRNVATVGGCMAHADPHMDLPPILSALGAHAVVLGPQGERVVPIEALHIGYYEVALARNELIAKVVVPPMGSKRAAYSKVTTRVKHDWPALGLAVSLTLANDGSLGEVSLVLGAVMDKPTRLVSVENLLRGAKPNDKVLSEAGAAAAASLDIVGDTHGSASYKKQLLRTYIGRTVRQALGAAHEGIAP